MRSQPNSWNTLLTKLGFSRRKYRKRMANAYGRKLRFEQCEDRRMLATFMVTNTDDAIENTPEAVGTLRQAIFDANLDDLPDTINFAANLFTQSGDPTKAAIQLTQSASTKSGLIITDDVTIEAPDGFELEISAASLTDKRVLQITNFTETTGVTLRNLAITGGNFSTLVEDGAGISTSSSTFLDNVRVEDNHTAGGNGGGMSVRLADTLEIIDSLFTNNSVGPGLGGGLYLRQNSTNQATIERTTFSFNTAAPDLPTGLSAVGLGSGGGVYVTSSSPDSTVLFEDVIIEQNTAYEKGGGLYISAASTLTASTGLIAIRNSIIRENSTIGKDPDGSFENSSFGGGVYVSTLGQSVLLDGLSITGNSAPLLEVSGAEESIQSLGGGIFISAFKPLFGTTHSVEIVNTTIAENRANIGGGIAFPLDNTGGARSVDATIIRHSTITANIAGELDIPGGIDAGRGRSNGGGISLGEFFEVVIDGSGTIGRASDYEGGLFLDHTIVTGNFHGDPNDPTVNNLNGAFTYNPSGTDQFDGEATAIAFSPDIGTTQGYFNYRVVGTNLELYDDPTYGAEYATLGISFSNLGTFSTTRLPESLLLSEAETPAGTLTRVDSLEHGIYFVPGGGFVDAGTPLYAPTSLPDYELGAVSGVIGTNEIEFDQRASPFARVADPTLGPVPGSRIDIGAIEVEPTASSELPPRVTSVIISNSNPQAEPPAYDFATATVADLITGDIEPVVGSGNQLRTVPVGGADTVEIVFDKPIDDSGGTLENSLVVAGLTTFNSGGITELVLLPDLPGYPSPFEYDSATNTARWTFISWDVADFYRISLDDTVTDLGGLALDGEWSNPTSVFVEDSAVSEFPSGDRNAGGDFHFVVTMLPGDASLDNEVNGTDFTILLDSYLAGIYDALFTDGDFDGNGVIDSTDFEILDQLNWALNFQYVSLLGDLGSDLLVTIEEDLIGISENVGMLNPTFEDGDLNGDGQIDQDDLDLAFEQLDLGIDWIF